MATLCINYAVWRRKSGNRRKQESKYGGLMIYGTWESDKTQTRIRQTIMNRHPNWHILGYCRVSRASLNKDVADCTDPKTRAKLEKNPNPV
jgi:hypothetical protein